MYAIGVSAATISLGGLPRRCALENAIESGSRGYIVQARAAASETSVSVFQSGLCVGIQWYQWRQLGGE